MEIIKTEKGFTEVFDHPIIQQLEFDFAGTCKILYHNQPSKIIAFQSDIYHWQYGIPVSLDGSTLFKGNWEDGVYAINAADGSVKWHYQQTKIEWVIAYPSYLIAIKSGASVIKLDIQTGAVVDEIRSAAIERCFALKNPYLLIDRIKGKLSLLDTEKMDVIRSYNSAEYNPNKCLSCLIQCAEWREKSIVISGVEEYPDHNTTTSGKRNFIRELPI